MLTLHFWRKAVGFFPLNSVESTFYWIPSSGHQRNCSTQLWWLFIGAQDYWLDFMNIFCLHVMTVVFLCFVNVTDIMNIVSVAAESPKTALFEIKNTDWLDNGTLKNVAMALDDITEGWCIIGCSWWTTDCRILKTFTQIRPQNQGISLKASC